MTIGTFINPNIPSIYDGHGKARLILYCQSEKVRSFVSRHLAEGTSRITQAPRGEARALSAGEGVIRTVKRTTKIIVASVIGLVCAFTLIITAELASLKYPQSAERPDTWRQTHKPENLDFLKIPQLPLSTMEVNYANK